MLTFAVLAATTVVLAAVGMLALVNTRSAVQGFDEEILPSVAKSLALAERVAHLAAAAPYIAEVAIASKLTQERAALMLRQQEVERIAGELPLARQSATGLPRLLGTLHAVLGELIDLKRQDLFLREDARAQLFALGQLQRRLPGKDERATLPRKDLDLLVLTLQVALAAPSMEELADAKSDYARRFARLSKGARGDGLSTLGTLPGLSESIFLLRQQQLGREDRKVYLLASTRFLSDELTSAINRHVAVVSADVSSGKNRVAVAVRSGLTAVAATFLVAGLALLVGFWTLREALKGLAKVTSAMTSLAEGGTDLAPLQRGRNTEIDALADAFEVFRKNTLAMRAMALDIAEKKTLLQTVFDNIDDGLSVFDARGRLVAWNPQYAQLLGLPPEAVHAGAALGDLQRAMPPLADASADASAGPGPLEATNVLRQTRAISVDLQFEDGRVLAVRSQPMPQGGFVTLYNDLSERRALELQVRQTQKMDVLGQLTGGVAHDFNNLLAAIVSNLQLLQSLQDLSAPARRIARRALKASERGGVLTMRLLAFARRQPLHRERIDIDRLLEGLEDLVAYSLGEGIRVELLLQAGTAQVLIDGGQLENAMLNLALNASAAMPKGGLLRIQTKRVLRAKNDGAWHGEAVEITVSDTGHGMPARVLERIFEPFFSTRGSEGSGLGLSIVYGFVRQSGGDIRASSTVNRGTAFVITLPLAEVSSTDVHSASPPLPQSVLPQHLQVLLVEDDVDVRESTQDLLEQQGATVTAVASSTQALQAMAHASFDLLLSDVGLGPGGDGLSLMHAAQRLHPASRVLLMSGLPSDLLAHRYGAPALRILRKPFLASELAQAVAAALRPRRASG
jgi:signal transduction histidine kinase